MGCNASAQPATVLAETTAPAGDPWAEEAARTSSPVDNQKTSSPLNDQKTASEGIEPGDFVYWSQGNLLDLEVMEVQEGKDDKDNQVVVKVEGKQHVIPQSQVVRLTGPRLHTQDLKKGAQVQFGWPCDDGKGMLGKGVIESQTNTEVCLKLQDGSRNRQLWISIGDIRFLYVMVFSAHSLKNTDKMFGIGMMNNKSDPYIKVHLQKSGSADSALQDKEGKANHMLKTKVLSDSLDPVWNQDFRFLYFDNVESIRFEVRDLDVLKEDDFLGHAELPKEKWEAKQEGFWDELTLTNEKGEPMKGDQEQESKIKVRVKLFEQKDLAMDDSQTQTSFFCGCQHDRAL